LRNAYEDARKKLGARDFKGALAMCQEALAKYPAHALFQALKVDIEETQRQDLSAFVARIDREAEAEPDLDRRVSILMEALTVHPGEIHFERALQLAVSKRDLVSSIVAKARSYEERRQFTEALNQWEMLTTIYATYPGLNFEVERLVKRRDQQTRADAKGRWVQQIDQSLSLFEYTRALELVRTAFAEFPEDAELKALEQLASQGQNRASKIQELVERGNVLCAEGQLDEGIKLLRQAYEEEREGKTPAIGRALLSALLEQARSVLVQNWRSADPLIQQALELDPNNPGAKSLRALVDDYEKQEQIEDLVSGARELQARGDIEGALARVEEALVSHPDDPRLVQLRNTLRNALPEPRRREMREHYLRELRSLVGEIDQAASAEHTAALGEQSRTLITRYPDDEFSTVGSGIEIKLQGTGQKERAVLSSADAPPTAVHERSVPSAIAPQPLADAPVPAPEAGISALARLSSPGAIILLISGTSGVLLGLAMFAVYPASGLRTLSILLAASFLLGAGLLLSKKLPKLKRSPSGPQPDNPPPFLKDSVGSSKQSKADATLFFPDVLDSQQTSSESSAIAAGGESVQPSTDGTSWPRDLTDGPVEPSEVRKPHGKAILPPDSTFTQQTSFSAAGIAGYTGIYTTSIPGASKTQFSPAGRSRLSTVSLTITNCDDPVYVTTKVIVDLFPFAIGVVGSALRLDFDPAVSGGAEIDFINGGFTIRDLSNKNGTFVEGRKLITGDPEALLFGSRISFGSNTQLMFKLEGPSDLPDLTNRTIDGRFVLRRRLHKSSTSVVYLANNINNLLQSDIAIKILSPQLAEYGDYRKLFMHEAQTAKGLRHDAICQMHECSELQLDDMPKTLFTRMEYLEGGSLADRLKRRDQCDVNLVGSWLQRLCSALAYLQQKNVIHRGIKPSAIVFDSKGLASLTDFALAADA
jgi:tetratricopeptide (TPR) repeat protein